MNRLIIIAWAASLAITSGLWLTELAAHSRTQVELERERTARAQEHAEAQATIAAESERARHAEQTYHARLSADRQAAAEDRAATEARMGSELDAMRSGTLRLRNQLTAAQRACIVPGDATAGSGATGAAILRPETAVAAVRVGDDADDRIRDIQRALIAAHELCGGTR